MSAVDSEVNLGSISSSASVVCGFRADGDRRMLNAEGGIWLVVSQSAVAMLMRVGEASAVYSAYS